jgi:hypothetical protein
MFVLVGLYNLFSDKCDIDLKSSIHYQSLAMKVIFSYLPIRNSEFVILIPDGSAGQEKNHATSQMPALVSEYLAPYSQLELNQSIVRTLFSMDSVSCLFMLPFSWNMSGNLIPVSCSYLSLCRLRQHISTQILTTLAWFLPMALKLWYFFCCTFEHCILYCHLYAILDCLNNGTGYYA